MCGREGLAEISFVHVVLCMLGSKYRGLELETQFQMAPCVFLFLEIRLCRYCGLSWLYVGKL
jgi:hypothetical protein